MTTDTAAAELADRILSLPLVEREALADWARSNLGGVARWWWEVGSLVAELSDAEERRLLAAALDLTTVSPMVARRAHVRQAAGLVAVSAALSPAEAWSVVSALDGAGGPFGTVSDALARLVAASQPSVTQ